MSSKEERLRSYLKEQINPVFEELVVELLKREPENFVIFFLIFIFSTYFIFKIPTLFYYKS
jgi:hypothetical protein